MTARTSKKPFEKTAQFYWVFVVLAAALYLITSFPGVLGALFTLVLLAVMAAVIRSVEGGADARGRNGSDGAPIGGVTEVVTLVSSIKGRLGGRHPGRTSRRPKRFQSIFMALYVVDSIVFALVIVVRMLMSDKGYPSFALLDVISPGDSYILDLILICVAQGAFTQGIFRFLALGARYVGPAQENDQQHDQHESKDILTKDDAQDRDR